MAWNISLPVRWRTFVAVGALATAIAAPYSALAEEAEPPSELERLAEDLLSDDDRAAIERAIRLLEPLVQRFETLLEDVPRYEAPEVLPNGDIIIRRKRDEPTPQIEPPASADEEGALDL